MKLYPRIALIIGSVSPLVGPTAWGQTTELMTALAAPPSSAGTAVVASASAAPPTQTAAGSSDALAEIVVTAEKRVSTVQDTPMSITAVSGDQLQAQGVSGIAGIAQEVPGISMRTAGPGQDELEMRGLSSSGGSSPTVGFYLDDSPLTAPAAAVVGKVVIDPDLFDLNRVEVLRGPQGTLYGSGSMGGTIKLVTNQPVLNTFQGAFETIGSGTIGGGANGGGNLMLNIPLIDDVMALRVVGTDKYTSGWADRTVVQPFPFPTNPGPCGPGWPGCIRGDVTAVPPTQTIPDVNWEHLQGGRAELLVKPTEALSITATAMYQSIDMGGESEYDAPAGTLAAPGSKLTHYQPFNVGEPFFDNFKLFSTTISYDLGFAALTSASSYYSRVESITQDASEAMYSVINLFGYPDDAFIPTTFTERDTTEQLSEEIRLASSGNGAFQWIGGAFFSHFQSIFDDTNEMPTLAYLSTGGAAANPTGAIYDTTNPYHIKQYAIFGESSYTFAGHLKLTTGLRWYEFNTDVNADEWGIATLSGNATPTQATVITTNAGFNPKATLSYEPDKDLTVYATAARGFRPGGANQPIPSLIGCTLTTQTYGPDSIWNYEVGEKAKLLDNRLVVNADFYYIQWSQVQQLINQACGYPLTQNAGNAASYGPELEITAHLTPELTLTATGTYTHATLSSVNPILTQADPGLHDGTAILNIPDYTESTSLTYLVPIAAGYNLMARVTNSYVGTSTDLSYVYAKLAPYDLVGLRVGLVADKWSGTLFVDNLTNDHAELGINTTSFDWVIPSLVRVATNQPTTIGLDLNYRF
jgi:iron complex outermembrane recepter protein